MLSFNERAVKMETENYFAEKLEMFREEINSQADAECSEIKRLAAQRHSGAEKARAEYAEREALSTIQAQKSKLSSRINKELSRCDFETKKAVLAHRNELIEKFFAEIKEQLCALANSAQYESILQKSAERARAELGEDAIISVSPRDMQRAEKLGIAPRADASIRIGGVRAQNVAGTLAGDYTLDKALENEKSAFSDNAQLRLS